MSWVTIVFSMIGSACLTLAAIYLLIWFRDRAAPANLLFSVTAVAAAATAAVEMWMMQADTPAEIGIAIRWGHVPVWFWVLGIVGFVRLYLRAGRPWLAWSVVGARSVSLLLNFATAPNLNYREVTALHRMPFLGESIAVAEGVVNPWMLVGQLSGVLLLIFVLDASITAWRSGDRRRAVAVGGSITFFLVVVMGESLLIWRQIHAPIIMSIPYLGLVVVMAYELSREAVRAARLAGDLRDTRVRMALAADAAQLGIWTRDPVSHDISATDRWRELFGFTESQRLEPEGFLTRVHPDDREAVRETLARSIGDGGDYETEYRLDLPAGQTRWIASCGHAQFDGKNQAILIRDASRDCTARKAAEADILLLRREIAHVGRVSMLGQLASALAHEINQPLGAILRNAEAAELFLQNPSPDLDEVRAILADIRGDDQRAGAVIDRMHALLERHELERLPVDVAELVREVIAFVKSEAAVRNVRLGVMLDNDLPTASGDRVHLQQVVLNLILNAMDALDGMPDERRRVSVMARRLGPDAIEVIVADPGPGIPADHHTRIFEPFFSTKANGMGMGLSISKTIIDAHHGRLWAESDDDGSTFRFTLPVLVKESRE
jgi:signal transduction histidine kinase